MYVTVTDLPPMSITHWSPAAKKLKVKPTPRTSEPSSKQIVLSEGPLVICRYQIVGNFVCEFPVFDSQLV